MRREEVVLALAIHRWPGGDPLKLRSHSLERESSIWSTPIRNIPFCPAASFMHGGDGRSAR